LIFEPNDSSAANEAGPAPNKIAKIRSHFINRSVVSGSSAVASAKADVLSGDSSSIVRADAPDKRPEPGDRQARRSESVR
jgi:hypothetical protein